MHFGHKRYASRGRVVCRRGRDRIGDIHGSRAGHRSGSAPRELHRTRLRGYGNVDGRSPGFWI
jgi:hypothetical protein